MVQGFTQAVRAIKKAQRIIISGHINPDGDCLGSLLGLGLGLKKLGKRVIMLRQGDTPRMYRRLPGAGLLKETTSLRADLAIAVDCSMPQMLGDAAYGVFHKAGRILEIDHHEFRTSFADISLIHTNAAAVGEIVYQLLVRLGVKLDKPVAENILTSIIVETNSFRLPAVRPLTFNICAALLKTGVDFYRLSEMVYWSKTPQAALLSGVCMSRAVFLRKGRLVWSRVTLADFKRNRGLDEDVDAVADEMRSIKGVRIAVLFREKNRRILRVSLRSKKGINVVRVAQHFGGGGHGDVAGCFLENSPQAIQRLLSLTGRLIPG